MIVDYLEKIHQEMYEKKLNLEREIQKKEILLNDNIKFIQALENSLDENFESFTPRSVNQENHLKIDALRNEQKTIESELNDLKILFNSQETKICQFKQALKSEKDLLKQTETILEEQLTQAKEKAAVEADKIYGELLVEQNQALSNLNLAINNYNKAANRLFGNDMEISETKNNMEHMQSIYNQTIISLEQHKQKRNGEFSSITSDVINGSINSNNYSLFTNDDINTLNELLLGVKELKQQIKLLETSIVTNMVERDEIAQKIVALNDRISMITTEREVYKNVVESTLEKAKGETTKKVGEIKSGVKKGAQGASLIGKGLYSFTKQKVADYVKKLEEDGYVDIEPEEPSTENTAEDYRQMLEDNGFFAHGQNDEKNNQDNAQASSSKQSVDNYLDSVANALGLDPEVVESGKKLVKSLFDNLNNGHNE